MSFRGWRKLSGGPWLIQNGDLLAPRRQDRQVRKFISLRPLRLCGYITSFFVRFVASFENTARRGLGQFK